ncbi:MAG TPA: hypothetical protein VF516_30380 [Kofleriaceae bacterium]
MFEGARSIEIDVHKDTPVLPLPSPPEPHHWTVYHTDKQSNSLCAGASCIWVDRRGKFCSVGRRRKSGFLGCSRDGSAW